MVESHFNPLGTLLDAGLGAVVEATLHRLLVTDQRSLNRLAALEGQQLLLELQVPPVRLVVTPHRDGLSLGGRLEGQADTRVRATLAGLVARLSAAGEATVPGIEVSGNTALAAELESILRDLDIDWEGLLGDRVGDLVAHPIAETLRSGREYLAGSRESLLADLDNYLHEELAVVPARPQLEQFYQGVDELRLAVDRLQARLDRLANRDTD